jgi:hypothetical protein
MEELIARIDKRQLDCRRGTGVDEAVTLIVGVSIRLLKPHFTSMSWGSCS